VTRAVLLCRVSTELQDEERQVRDLSRLAAERGWGVLEIVRERVSGTRTDRPGLAHVLELARSRAVDVLAVSELSRLSRAGIGPVFDILRELDAAGVRVVSLSEPWAETTGPMRDLLFALLAWAAKLERDLLSERTRSGLARVRAEGKRIGRPPVLSAELLSRIRELRETPDGEGNRRTWAAIARIVHHPAGSLKKWYSASRRETPRVINCPREIVTPAEAP
jgi:putative DNA-invertase from lambdoid prophage Rac